MSKTTPTACISYSPKLHATFEASLKEYESKTEKSLLTHPLMVQLQDCNSPADILVVLRSSPILVQVGLGEPEAGHYTVRPLNNCRLSPGSRSVNGPAAWSRLRQRTYISSLASRSQTW